MPYIGFGCWLAASQGEQSSYSQSGRASHRPSASSSRQQQAAAGSRPGADSGRQAAHRAASSQPASSSQKLSTATQPSKQDITRSASAQVRAQCQVACGIHAPASGIQLTRTSKQQATSVQRQNPASNQRPGRTRKLGMKFQVFYML